jgi:hypothetical protein
MGYNFKMELKRNVEWVHGMSARRYAGKLAANKRYRERHPEKIRAYKLEPYMEKHGLTHEQLHGPEVEEEDDEDEAA